MGRNFFQYHLIIRRLLSSVSTLALVVIFTATSALALSLEEAKQRGLVGEEPSGYLGVVQDPPSGEVRDLVKDINSRRKAKYAEIAQSNGTPVSAVEALAGQKAIQETKAGAFIKSKSGHWIRK